MGKSQPQGKQVHRGITAYQKAMGKNSNEDGFLKTAQKTEKALPQGKEEPKQASKYRRAAQFMVLIGSDEASRILSRLDPGQVEAISKEIVTIGSINPEEAEAVLEEFRSLLSPSYGYSGSSSGGVEEARRLLYAAFGPEKGETLLLKAVPEAAENPFDFLKEFSGEQLALLFKDESPAACAMVFSRLPSKLSAAVLSNINADRKLEILRRIAHLKETSPEVLERTAAALREKARYFGRDERPGFAGGELDGKNVLTAILKHSDLTFGGRLLEEMKENDPSLSKELKDRLYTLEDVVDAADRPIQEKLAGMDDREIALLLKGRSETFTQKILGNISQTRSEQIMEESEIMGAVPKIEAEAAAREFLSWFRLNREEGRILMLKGEDVLV
jgi:flagellar motor switch protein FliG